MFALDGVKQELYDNKLSNTSKLSRPSWVRMVASADLSASTVPENAASMIALLEPELNNASLGYPDAMSPPATVLSASQDSSSYCNDRKG